MFTKSTLSLFLLSAILASGTVPAKGAEIGITGTVTSGACNISAPNQSFAFEDLYTSKMSEAGSASKWKSFSIMLTACPTGTRNATMKISGTVATEDPAYFANTEDAKNVVLELTDSSHLTTYSNGSTLTAEVDDSRNAFFPLAARVYSPNGGVGAGTFESVVMIDFTYQ